LSIAAGTRLGPYEIVAPIGAGGMGEVYRARDTRLDRDVAIKELPQSVAAREDVRARFEREARAISALNHPNICTLHDVGREGDIEYLVMELLEGDTLASLLGRGKLAPERAMKFAIEIATALDRAHKAGIVHRDLKPGNVMITRAGVKLLDFGLARTTIQRHHDATTMINPITEEGTIVGTLEYMSPEQLEGKATDARTDIFSFGCIVYEMFTGRRAFSGGSTASLITAIMSSEPPAMSTLTPLAPAPLERLVRKCLEKNPDDRWQSAGDLATELRWIAEGSADVAPKKRASRLPWWIAAASLLALLIAVIFALRPRTSSAQIVRASLPLVADAIDGGILSNELAISPDGQWLAYVGIKDGKPSIWLRSLTDGTVAPIPKSGDAVSPFWSPDSQQIAFAQRGKLVRMPRAGGDLTPICDIDRGVYMTGAWGSDGTIVIGKLGEDHQLLRVPASGGTPQDIPHKHVTAVVSAMFIDAHRVAYCTVTHGGDLRLHMIDLRSMKEDDAGLIDSRPSFVGDTMLFVRAGTLLAQKVDDKLQRIGEPVNIAGDVDNYAALGAPTMSVSATTIVYASSATDAQIGLFDGRGAPLGLVGPIGVRHGPQRSHDGKRLVAPVADPRYGNGDLWVIDLQRNSSVQLTSTPLGEEFPVWMPGDKTIVYSYELDGPPHLFSIPSSGGEPTQILPVDRTIQYVADATPDGKWVLFSRSNPGTRRDLWRVAPAPGSTPEVWLRTQAYEGLARVSPDGKLASYASDASGANEVYVAPFDDPRERVQVSSSGDAFASAWRADGKELYYVTASGGVFSVAINNTNPLDVGKPQLLFRASGIDSEAFDVSPDGKTFYICRSTHGPLNQPLNLIANWQQLLVKH